MSVGLMGRGVDMCKQTMLYVRNPAVRAEVKRAAACAGVSMSKWIEDKATEANQSLCSPPNKGVTKLDAVKKICRAALERDPTLVDEVMTVLE